MSNSVALLPDAAEDVPPVVVAAFPAAAEDAPRVRATAPLLVDIGSPYLGPEVLAFVLIADFSIA